MLTKLSFAIVCHARQLLYGAAAGEAYGGAAVTRVTGVRRGFWLTRAEDEEAFAEALGNFVLLTYRHSFWVGENLRPPSAPFGVAQWMAGLWRRKGVHTDAGWGCTLRVFQMALAEVAARLATDGSPSKPELAKNPRLLARILAAFCDAESAPFGIHRLIARGRRDLDIHPPAQWYGPTSCARLFSLLVNDYHAPGLFGSRPLHCFHFDDAHVRTSALAAAPAAALLFVSVRLGLDRVELATYKEALQNLFALDAFCGICGGDAGTAAFYFVACNDQYLYYLDPHVKVQPALLSVRCAQERLVVNGEVATALAGTVLAARPPSALPWERLNPSMSLVLLSRDLPADLPRLRRALRDLIYFDDAVAPADTTDDYLMLSAAED